MKFWEAMKALDEGKVIETRGGFKLSKNANGRLVFGDGSKPALVSWETWFDGSSTLVIYEEPGHDFSWAIEQIKQGKMVRQKSRETIRGFSFTPDADAMDKLRFSISEVLATDWILVR